MSYIGKNIKKLRSVKGLSQAKFAELFDIKRASIGAYEEGRAEPKTDTIIMIANEFNLSLDNLLARELTVNQLSGFNLSNEEKANNISKPVISPNLISKKKFNIDNLHREASFSSKEANNISLLICAAILTAAQSEYIQLIKLMNDQKLSANDLDEIFNICRRFAGLSIEKEILHFQSLLV